MSYKVRFHLGQGQHFMHWQVTNLATKKVTYYDPNRFQLNMGGCTLKNQSSTAKKIHDGAHKTVCAWIIAETVRPIVILQQDPKLVRIARDMQTSYNPRVAPHWTDQDGNNIDNMTFRTIMTYGRELEATV